MSTSEVTLEPCPFCGGEVERVMPPCSDMSEYIRHVGSASCPVEFTAFTLDEDLSAAWNTRAALTNRDAAIEEAAKVAEDFRGPPPLRHLGTCRGIAKAIRALKSSTPTTPLSERGRVEVSADHPLAKAMKLSTGAANQIAEQERATAAGYQAVRNMPLGSSTPTSGEAGLVLVPREPTEEMLAAAHDGPLGAAGESMADKTRSWLTEMWQAMIDVALASQHREAIEEVTQRDIDAASFIARLTGWKGVSARLDNGWRPEPGTSEANLIEFLARYRSTPTSGEASAPPPLSERCMIPPEGWWCSRQAGHEGPCAARPINPAKELCDALYRRFDDEPDFLGHEAAAWIDAAGEALQRIHRYALAAEGVGYDLILSVTKRFIASPTPAESGAGAREDVEAITRWLDALDDLGVKADVLVTPDRRNAMRRILAALAPTCKDDLQVHASTSQMREALEPFAQIAEGEVFECWAAQHPTLLICNLNGKRLAAVSAERFIRARQALERNQS